MGSKKLFIFVSSKESDPYINSISHCIENEQIEEVCLLDIIPETGKKNAKIIFLSDLKEKIYSQFENLRNGNYLTSRGDLKINCIDIAGKTRYNEYVTKLSKDKFDLKIILYSELSDFIKQEIEKQDCLFDVTPTSKNYLIDIFTVIIANNYRHIYYFELLSEGRKYDETELIHHLTKDKTYRYDNITDGRFIKGKKLIDEKFNIEIFNTIKHELSHYYAMFFLSWLLFICCLAITIIYKSIPYVSQNWNTLEPSSFVFGALLIPLFSTYILGIIYIAILRREIPSLSPWSLYQKLKNNYLDKIEKRI